MINSALGIRIETIIYLDPYEKLEQFKIEVNPVLYARHYRLSARRRWQEIIDIAGFEYNTVFFRTTLNDEWWPSSNLSLMRNSFT